MIKLACRCTALFVLLALTAGVASAQDAPKPRRQRNPYAAIQEFTDVFERVRADAATPAGGPSGLQLQGKGLQPDVAVSSDDEGMALEQAVAALRKRL